MSVAGANCAEISVAPRMLRDRTRRIPGTSSAACSSGLVTVSIIDCGGSVPLLAMITMRGKPAEDRCCSAAKMRHDAGDDQRHGHQHGGARMSKRGARRNRSFAGRLLRSLPVLFGLLISAPSGRPSLSVNDHVLACLDA